MMYWMNNSNSLIKSLMENPDEWEVNSHHLSHKSSGISLWISNGFFGFSGDNCSIRLQLGLVSRYRLWRAYRLWNKRYVQNILEFVVI